MPLYLDEIYWNATSPDNTKKVFELLQGAIKGGLPHGITLKAGPWASNEEAKIILVLDIPDHSLTFNTFANIVAQGLITRRRLTPIVEWGEVEKMVAQLSLPGDPTTPPPPPKTRETK